MADTAPIPTAPAKSRRKLLVLLVAVIVVLVGAGAGTVAVLRSKTSPAKPAEHAEETAHAPEVESGVVALEPFVTNLAGGDGDRFIKCTLRLEFERREESDKIKASEIAITRLRDRILTLLSSQRFDAVVTAEGKETLRAEIRTQAEDAAAGAKVREVYYTEFLVQ